MNAEDEHPLPTPISFYYNAGHGKWELHSIGAAECVEALHVWLHVHNPQTLALGSTLYASVGGMPTWEALPGGALLEFETSAPARSDEPIAKLYDKPATAIWSTLLLGLGTGQFGHVCATDCACGYADAPLTSATAVSALALCIRDKRIRIEIWLRSTEGAESVAKRARRMLLDVQFIPRSISLNTFERLEERKKGAIARY
jgi:hypothetical protein